MKKSILKLFSEYITNSLGAIFLLLILIVIFPIYILFLPFDYISYKKSPYCKDTKQRYALFITTLITYEIYNQKVNSELPIDYIDNPEDPKNGWFIFKNTLIIPSLFDFSYDKESNKWVVYGHKDEETDETPVFISLDDYISLEIHTINSLLNQKVCTNAVVLIREGKIINEDEEKAKEEKRFIIYNKKNLAEKLNLLCSQDQSYGHLTDASSHCETPSKEENIIENSDISSKGFFAFMLDAFDKGLKWAFFYDFKKSRKEHGALKASVFLFLLCIIRGLSKVIFKTGTFWEGFLYPFAIFLGAFAILAPIFILSKKAPKVASVIVNIFLILSFIFLGGIVLLLVILLLNSVFHFWF